MTEYRNKIFQYVKDKYKSQIEYLWLRFPGYCIFRHDDNRKWYGIVMDVSYQKLGINKDGVVDILNVKIDDCVLRDMLLHRNGFLSGYHISRGNWISILLDKSVELDEIFNLIDQSYNSTATRRNIDR